MLRWKWELISDLTKKTGKLSRIRGSGPDLATVMAILPLSMLVPIHLLNPVLIPYALISFSPFFVVAMSRGVFAFGKGTQWMLIAAIFILCVFSVQQSANIPNPRDYKELADKLMLEIREGDVLLIENKWYSLPVIYYFPPSRHLLRPVAALFGSQNPGTGAHVTGYTRFWLVDFAQAEIPREYFLEKKRILSSILKEVKQIEAGKGVAILFQSDVPRSILPDQLHYPKI